MIEIGKKTVTTLGIVAFVVLAGWIVNSQIANETIFRAGYSDSRFLEVELGMNEREVTLLLGPPLAVSPASPGIYWYYASENVAVLPDGGVDGEAYIVVFDFTGRARHSGGVLRQGTQADLNGKSMEEIRQTLGRPTRQRVLKAVKYLEFSRAGKSGTYSVRKIGINDGGNVVEKLSYFYVD